MCGIGHFGGYASGRFCNRICARRFSTAGKREEINSAVSKKLKGRQLSPEAHEAMLRGFKMGRERRHEKAKATRSVGYTDQNWDDLTTGQRRYRVFYEQQGKCLICHRSEWLSNPLPLEYDHVNGDRHDNSRENVRGLCPNCHSQTATWRGRNKSGKQKVDDETLLVALREQPSVHRALKSVGLAGGKNYLRAWKLLDR